MEDPPPRISCTRWPVKVTGLPKHSGEKERRVSPREWRMMIYVTPGEKDRSLFRAPNSVKPSEKSEDESEIVKSPPHHRVPTTNVDLSNVQPGLKPLHHIISGLGSVTPPEVSSSGCDIIMRTPQSLWRTGLDVTKSSTRALVLSPDSFITIHSCYGLNASGSMTRTSSVNPSSRLLPRSVCRDPTEIGSPKASVVWLPPKFGVQNPIRR